MLRAGAKFARAAAQILLPPACVACHRALGPARLRVDVPLTCLCEECGELLRPIDLEKACPRCCGYAAPGSTPGKCPDCEPLGDWFAEARSAFPYQSPAGEIVRNLKYRRSPFLADWLVRLSLPAVGDWLAQRGRDCQLVPVPMARLRWLSRGYNQAEEIARAMTEALPMRIAHSTVLQRIRRRKPQARFASRAERLANLADVYRVPQPENIHGREFLLVDDVMTTGATMAAAARALREAGAAQVFAFAPVRAHLADDSVGDEC